MTGFEKKPIFFQKNKQIIITTVLVALTATGSAQARDPPSRITP